MTFLASFAFSVVRDLLLRAKHLFVAAGNYALATRSEPADIATGGIVDGRGIAAGRLAGDDPASGIVERGRAAAVGRRAADVLPGAVVVLARLRRGCAGHHRERQQCQQNLFPSAFGRDIDGLAAGIKIGLRVREMDWATSVTNECAYVCGMIWLAGTILLPAKRGRAEQRLSSVDQSTRRRCEVLQRD